MRLERSQCRSTDLDRNAGLASTNVSSPTASSQEFVYNGIVAQSPSSIAHSSDYSLCNEFSSYDEISHTEVVTVQPSQSVSSPVNVFKGDLHPPLHRTDQSVASLESIASYCVVSKRPPIQRIPPMVIHGKQSSVDSSTMSAEDMFAGKMPNIFGRSAHCRAGSFSPSPAQRASGNTEAIVEIPSIFVGAKSYANEGRGQWCFNRHKGQDDSRSCQESTQRRHFVLWATSTYHSHPTGRRATMGVVYAHLLSTIGSPSRHFSLCALF
jgi:hypothetical protein